MGLPVLYPMRSVDTATVRFSDHPHGRRRITIVHRPLPGVTADMLVEWFTTLDGTMTYGGATVRRYLAWHPLDHIDWQLATPSPNGRPGEGARFRIVEAFGANPEYRVDVTDDIEKLDHTGIRLVTRFGGAIVFQLEHTWSSGGQDGAHYVSVLDIGARAPWMAPVNAVLHRRFPRDMARAWVKHNIEEVGRLEYLLPAIADQTNRNQRSAHAAATPPQAARTASPNQSTESVIA